LVLAQGGEPGKIGIVGHSMGGKDAVLAAAQYGGFAVVVAIDPDDNGNVSVVHGPIADLKAPLLLIGAEVAWRASSVCAPLATNYLRFFEQAPTGTVELARRPFHIDAMVILPDHIHALWTLPPDDAEYSIRWRNIKRSFTQHTNPPSVPPCLAAVNAKANKRYGNADSGNIAFVPNTSRLG
jgi:pimeloyl-ACP methyl ester carboxylesterase